jgi:hypothetical protein
MIIHLRVNEIHYSLRQVGASGATSRDLKRGKDAGLTI